MAIFCSSLLRPLSDGLATRWCAITCGTIGILSGPLATAADYVEGEAIVIWKSGTTSTTATASATRHGATIRQHFPWLSQHRKQAIGVMRTASQTTTALIKDLQSDPDVLSAEPNYLRKVSSLHPNDSAYNQLWALTNTGQTINAITGTSGADIRFINAWNLARPTGSEVVVAILDTGLDSSHPDIAANLWTNSAEIASNNLDDDGNGYINDIHGYNFADGNATIDDSGEHGTHVAGTIAATGNNNLGVIGVNFKAHVMALKISNDGTNISTSAEISALQYATMMKSRGVNIVAINASFGGGSYSSAESAAIKAAGDAGIVFCAAAGNETANNNITATYPANYRLSNMIVVAATTSTNQLASYSNYGATTVDLAAPGSNIESLMPTWFGTSTASVTKGTTNFAAEGFAYANFTHGITTTMINCGTGNAATDFPSTVRNHIALIQRGAQTFATKITNAMNAGAIGAIIYNNTTGAIGGTLGSPGTWIPTVAISQADGATLVAASNSTVTLTNSMNANSVYQFMDGTSMATPHVAAAVAFAAYNFPTESASQRVARVINHTTALSALTGKVKSGGCLNLLSMIDTDANGLPDWWESDYFNSLGVNPNSDADADGMTNLQEFFAGTNPKNSSSKLAISQTAILPNGQNRDFRLTFPSVNGVTYRVEYSNTLAPNSWSPLSPDLSGTGNNLQITDPAANTHSKRFYRLSVVP